MIGDYVISVRAISVIIDELGEEGCATCARLISAVGMERYASDFAQSLDELSCRIRFNCWYNRARGLAKEQFAQVVIMNTLPPGCADGVRHLLEERAFAGASGVRS